MILNDQIIGMMQLTFIPGLSMQGITRCQIESVRIKKEYRDKGYGSKLINKGIEIEKIKGSHSSKIKNILGYSSREEIVHKDYLVKV